jgi:hypothetical protein
MKTCLLLLVASLGLTLLGGCAKDPEEKAFFERGWLHPKDLDAPSQKAMP